MKKNFIYIFIISAIFLLAGFGVFAADYIKTTEFFISSSDIQISTATNNQFSIYIGDNISTITNPVKSLYFTISGVYTGGGSLEFEINSDPATSKIFTMPSVISPTPFEIIYKDDTNKINPSSAGTYNYTFNVIPSGIIISGLGVKANLTHRYVPQSCGGTYPAIGEIISPVFDTGAANGVTYNKIILKGSTSIGTKIRFQLATAATSTGPWIYRGPEPACDESSFYWDGVMSIAEESKEVRCYSQHNNKRYFKYKAILCSGDCSNGGNATPQINDVIINWSP